MHQFNTGVREKNDVLKKRGRLALAASSFTLLLAGYLYWQYIWDHVWGFFEVSFNNL